MNKNKTPLIVILILLILILFCFLIFINTNKNEAVINQTKPINEDYLSQEKNFQEPIEITWTGRISGCLVSCEAYSVELIPQIEGYKKMYLWAPENSTLKPGDYIKVSGKWTGITCAYYNTVFGQCVPEVYPEKIEAIDESLQIK